MTVSAIHTPTTGRSAPRFTSASIRFLVVILAGTTLLTYGCSYVMPRRPLGHSLEYIEPPKINQSQIQDTLTVYPFNLAPSVDAYSLILRRPNGSEKRLGKHRWNRNPADMITDLIQRDLAQAGPFSRTIGPNSNDDYRYALEGKVTEFQAVIEDKRIYAVLEVKVILTDFEAPYGAKKTLLNKPYRVRALCSDDEPQTIVKALTKSTQEFSALLLKDVSDAMKKPSPGGNRKIRSQPARV